MDKEFNKYKLPDNWIWVELGDILETTSGGTPSRGRSDYYNGTIPWVKSGELNYNIITKTEEQITDAALQSSSAKLFPKGTMLIALYGATVGRLAFLGIDASTNQAVCGIFQNSNIHIKYIYYCLMNQYSYLISLSAGGAQPNISQTIIKKVNIPLPPLNEQNRIVDKLDELLSELEKGKAQLQIALEQLKVYRQSILKHAFEGKLTEEWRSKQKKLKTPDELVAEIKAYRKQQYETQLKEYKAGEIKIKPKEPKEIIPVTASEIKVLPELPNGWTYVKVSSLGDIETGTTPSKAKPEYYGDKYPFYKPTELDAGFNVRKAKEYLSESGINQARFLPVNSILVTSIGATIGKTGIIRVAGASNQQINAIVPHEIFNSNFLYFQAVGQHFQDQIQSNAVATTLPILNKSKFEKLVFAICSQEEQNFIVDGIESKFSNIEKMEETIVQNIEVSHTLKQSLLQKSFEGKLVEQDPRDEPASVLLERIRAEREAYLKNNKTKKKVLNQPLVEFPRAIPDIAATDLHAGIISMIIDAHVCNAKYSGKLNHVKCEKIADLVERKLGISLGRKAMKDAAGPDDYPHLKKVEHRAKMIGAFATVPLKIGHTYKAMKNMPKCIEKAQVALSKTDLEKVNELINTFLPFDLEHAELVATIYAGWNNLLIKQQIPTDEEIVYESRENWSKRKLTIPRENFFKTLNWMRAHHFVPQGKGQLVLKNNKHS